MTPPTGFASNAKLLCDQSSFSVMVDDSNGSEPLAFEVTTALQLLVKPRLTF